VRDAGDELGAKLRKPHFASQIAPKQVRSEHGGGHHKHHGEIEDVALKITGAAEEACRENQFEAEKRLAE
jgi:hypothetical protein